VSIPSKV